MEGDRWGSIVILAAISNINPEYYESAIVDSRQVKEDDIHYHTTVDAYSHDTLLLRIGSFIELNFDQIMNLITPMTYSKGDVIDTYIYRVGIGRMEYSATTAVGLFQSVIGFLLVLIRNSLSTKYTGRGYGNEKLSGRRYSTVNYIFLILFGLAMIIPLISVLAISLSSAAVYTGKVSLLPVNSRWLHGSIL